MLEKAEETSWASGRKTTLADAKAITPVAIWRNALIGRGQRVVMHGGAGAGAGEPVSQGTDSPTNRGDRPLAVFSRIVDSGCVFTFDAEVRKLAQTMMRLYRASGADVAGPEPAFGVCTTDRRRWTRTGNRPARRCRFSATGPGCPTDEAKRDL